MAIVTYEYDISKAPVADMSVALTCRQLIEALERMPPELKVIVEGYDCYVPARSAHVCRDESGSDVVVLD
jgi:hypothetical protein